MKITLLALLLQFITTAGCREHENTHSRYLALGDSYTCGESVSEADSYPFQLAARLKAAGDDVGRPTVVAVTGWTTGDLQAGIDRATLHSQYDLVTLLIGVNNQFRRRPTAEFQTQFAALLLRSIALAGGRPGHVIVISIPDWSAMPIGRGRDVVKIGRDIDGFNTIASEAATQSGVAWVDVTRISRGATTRPALGADDDLHPSGLQYAKWVDALLPAATRALGGGVKDKAR